MPAPLDPEFNPGDPFKILYLVVHDVAGADEFSPFQGFGRPFLDTVSGLAEIALLPADVRELGMDRNGVLRSRLLGEGTHAVPLQINVLAAFLERHPASFVCVYSPASLQPAVAAILAQVPRPVLHRVLPGDSGAAHADPADGDPQLGPADAAAPAEAPAPGGDLADPWAVWVARRRAALRALRAHLERVAVHAASERPAVAEALRAFLAQVPAEPPEADPLDVVGHTHGVTRPSETALVALGYEFPRGRWMDSRSGDAVYAAEQLPAAQRVRVLRREAVERVPGMRALRTADLVLTAPSVYAHLYVRKHRRPHVPGNRSATAGLRAAFDALAGQTGYPFRDLDGGVVRDPQSRDALLGALAVRQEEMEAYTTVLALRAASDVTPVLRLPAGANQFRGAAINLAQSARRQSTDGGRQLNRLARQLSQSLTRAVPPELLPMVQDPSTERVVIVADAPLEWLEIDGLPLMLTRDCSRLPTTPGNVFVINAVVAAGERMVSARRFEEVLVVRSYDRTDPVRPLLERAARHVLGAASGARTRLRIVDVATAKELIAALDGYDGAIMIFDGHGAAGSLTSPGALRIGREAVDPWTIRAAARVPPIVLLSACDTHALDAAHASPVNAFLAAGAKTVVGTSLPVDARYAAIFVARLLLRLEQYLPMLLTRPLGLVRWSEILPGLQRMNYVSEALAALVAAGAVRLTVEDRRRVAFAANMAINDPERGAPPAAWYGRFAGALTAAAGIGADTATRLLREHAWITDALKYVQYGNPDRVLIAADDHAPPPPVGAPAAVQTRSL